MTQNRQQERRIKTKQTDTRNKMLDPRVTVYGMFTAVFFAWEIHASNNYTAVPILVLLGWIFVLSQYWRIKGIHLVPFLLYHASTIALRSPATFEVEIWGMQVDFALALWLLFAPSTADADDACRTLRDMFTWYYLASGVWKLNSHFIDPDASCAVMFLVQLVANYVSPFCSYETLVSIARVTKTISPIAALFVELSFGFLKLAGTISGNRACERAGVLLALAFHLNVCFLPIPNDISNFALHAGTRLIVFSSIEGTRKAIVTTRLLLPYLMAVSGVVLSIGISRSFSVNDWAFALFVPIGGFVAYAVIVESSPAKEKPALSTSFGKTGRRRNRWMWLASGVAFCYSFVGVILGIQEESTPNMFANLKTHGGSNHFFLPTGLLFHVYGDSPDNYIFGGGEIRIEETTSTWLKHVYPNDLTGFLQPPIMADLLERIDSPAPVYFNPGLARVLGITDPSSDWFQYTVPALEVKKLLREAKTKDRDFDLIYAQLPGTKGDEVWRSTATKRRFYIEVRNGEVSKCDYLLGNEGKARQPCGPEDLPMLPDNSIPSFIWRISSYLAYPVVPKASGEFAPSIKCFGP